MIEPMQPGRIQVYVAMVLNKQAKHCKNLRIETYTLILDHYRGH